MVQINANVACFKKENGICQCKIVKLDDPNLEEYETWETVNGTMLSLIINFVDKQIANTLMYRNSAAVAWTDLRVLPPEEWSTHVSIEVPN